MHAPGEFAGGWYSGVHAPSGCGAQVGPTVPAPQLDSPVDPLSVPGDQPDEDPPEDPDDAAPLDAPDDEPPLDEPEDEPPLGEPDPEPEPLLSPVVDASADNPLAPPAAQVDCSHPTSLGASLPPVARPPQAKSVAVKAASDSREAARPPASTIGKLNLLGTSDRGALPRCIFLPSPPLWREGPCPHQHEPPREASPIPLEIATSEVD